MTRDLAIYRHPWLAKFRHSWKNIDPQLPPDARLCERALLMWNERSDLQQAYDLTCVEGRIGLFWWTILHGFRELGFRFSPDLDAPLLIVNQPFPDVSQKSFLPITWLMRALWAGSDWNIGGIQSEQEQFHCLAHYYSHALLDFNLAGFLTHEQATALVEEDTETGNPRLYQLIFYCDPKLQARFGSETSADFIRYCQTEGSRDWPILSHPLVSLAPPSIRLRRTGAVRGVNLFGHALGRLGIGEDVRMAARSLEAAGIDYVIRNVDAGSAGNEEDAAKLRLSDDSPFDINLFCMTGISTITTAIAEGEGLREGRYSIGLWPWELPEWPKAFDHAWDFVDEVWATSAFTYTAYSKSAKVPVTPMPMAVVTEETEGANRTDFELPHDAFLFGYSFDGLSSLARKNPEAVVKAFHHAFPPEDHSVGLVLKGIRADANAPALASLMTAIDGDDRIILINESFTRGKLLDLYRSIDAFVSLHRSEGFGRNIAEAMLLGVPVIATAYSGNLDFTHEDNTALVKTRLCKVQPGEYPFGTGQVWGEPDPKGAALAMQRMVQDETWRKKIARRGQTFIRNTYSPQAVGAVWARRLRELEREI